VRAYKAAAGLLGRVFGQRCDAALEVSPHLIGRSHFADARAGAKNRPGGWSLHRSHCRLAICGMSS
jgi:hypothetical protein